MTEIETAEAELEYMRAGFSRKEAAKAVKVDHAIAEDAAQVAHAEAQMKAYLKALDALTPEQRLEFQHPEDVNVK